MSIIRKLTEHNLSVLFIFILIIVSAYSFMLQGSFKTLDDDIAIVHNPYIRDVSHLDEIFKTSYFRKNLYYRPLVITSYLIDYHLFGLNAFCYYFVNIFLHIAVTMSVFYVVGMFLKDRMHSFCVGLLFAIHPVHWEAVSNISGRSILLSALFYILAFYSFCLFFKKGKNILYYAASVIFFILSLISKESAFVFPLLLAVYVLIFEKRSNKELPSLILLILPFGMVLIGYMLWREHLGFLKFMDYRNMPTILLEFMTFFRGVLTYFRIFILPTDLHFDRSQPSFVTFANPSALISLSVLLGLVILFFKFKNRLSKISLFFIFWFFIELFPVSQIPVSFGIQPGFISLAEHFLYLPSVGVFVVAVLAVRWLWEKNEQYKFLSYKLFLSLLMSIYVFFFVMTVQYNIYASNELIMCERTIKYQPQNLRIRYSLSMAYIKRGLLKQAQEHLTEALKLAPDNARFRITFAETLCDHGRFWECLEEYEKIKNPLDLEELYENNINAAYRMLIAEYEAFIKKNPNVADGYYSLGVVYSKQKKPQEAIGYYKKTLELNPQHKNAHFNLASSYEINEQWEEAVIYYQRVLGLKDSQDDLDYYAALHLSKIYHTLGQEKIAEENLHKAKTLQQEGVLRKSNSDIENLSIPVENNN